MFIFSQFKYLHVYMKVHRQIYLQGVQEDHEDQDDLCPHYVHHDLWDLLDQVDLEHQVNRGHHGDQLNQVNPKIKDFLYSVVQSC